MARYLAKKYTYITTATIIRKDPTTMRVTSIAVRRTKQLKQYEPEVIEVNVELNEGDTVAAAIASARATIASHFGEMPSTDEIERAQKLIEQANAPRFD